jgi:predicted phosphoribosyltransferase
MIVRQSLNFLVHLAAGIAVGALAVAALAACRRREPEDIAPFAPAGQTRPPVEDEPYAPDTPEPGTV